MTVIVAINSGDEIVIGYNDGAELDGSPVVGSSCPWIFFGEWALGITGESSVQRLLAHKLKSYSNSSDSAALIDCINRILLDNDIGFKEDGEFVRTFGISGIIVNRGGKIWDVSGCLTLAEIPTGIVWARGSGADYALGAYHALNKIGTPAPIKEKLAISLEVAIENDIYCVGSGIVRVL